MKILVPVDGSAYSRAAIDFIASRTTLIGARAQVELLNVQVPVPARAARLVGKSAVDEYYQEEANKALAGALLALQQAGVAAHASHVVGHPAEEIAKRADADGVDLIAMGSHGHGALATLLLGSVTRGLMARTTRPLLLLRGHGPAPADSLAVGIAVDGSDYSIAAARYALRHRALFGAQPQFTLIHAVPEFAGATMPDMAGIALPAYSADEIRALQESAFDKAVAPVRALFDEAGVDCASARLTGPPGNEIAAFARSRPLDLLLMGSHGYGALRAAALGSVATRVAAHCKTPLLLIREP